jgi:hypothetical protein
MHDGSSHIIGLSVGIPVAIILGLLAGWLLFRRRKSDTMAHEVSASATEQHESNQGGYDCSKDMHEAPGPDLHEAAVSYVHEAPPHQVLEMGHSEEQNLTKWGGELDNDPAPGSLRYEMDTGSSVEPHNQALDSGKQLAKTDI